MTSVTLDIETLLTTVYVVVDDWYQANGRRMQPGKAGAKPRLSDSEVLTLALAEEYVPYGSEGRYVDWLRANYGGLFPALVDQSEYNRRVRGLRGLLEGLRSDWLAQVLSAHDYLVVDTKPIPVVGYTRDKRHSDFAGSATYGYCAARKLHYFGYKLVMVCTPDGLPVLYDLVPANTDERAAAETVLFALDNATVLADKGFIGSDWQAILADETGNHVLTPKRANQHDQNPTGFDDWLNARRERIESLFNQLQNTGRHLEHLLAKTVVGLATRIALKVTALVLRRLLCCRFGFDVLSFSISH